MGEAHHKTHTTNGTNTHIHRKKWKQNNKVVNGKKPHNTQLTGHGVVAASRYVPPHKYVTGLFPSEVIIVLQYYFVCIPNNHPELISGEGEEGHIHTHSWTASGQVITIFIYIYIYSCFF